MQLRTYHADTVADALDAIKRDLGADALIVQTRSFRRGGVLGIGARTVIEITATVAPARTVREAAPYANSTAPRERTKGGRASQTVDPSVGAAARAYRQSATLPTGDSVASLDVDRERTRRLAMAMLEQQERAGARTVAPPPTVPTSARFFAAPADPTVSVSPPPPPPTEPAATPSTSTARRYLLVEPDQPASPVVEARQEPAGPSMRDELAAIRELVEQVLVRQPDQGLNGRDPVAGMDPETEPERPAALQDIYLRLVGQDLADELAAEIVAKVEGELSSEAIADVETLRSAVLRHLEELIPVADAPLPPASPDGRPITIALIGPTGVGKTTTLAKLAAAFKLRHGLRVGLVTCDTYRIAAVDQLRTYANIIGVPLHVAMTPEDMRIACAKLKDCDAVLIDTAGRSQNDTARIHDLRAFLDAAQPHEVHLVLSCTAGEKVLVREAEAFGVVGADKIVLTKLDEAVSFGMLVNTVRQVGKSISFLTTGQEVPDQIEIGRSRRIAELILNGADKSGERDGGAERP